MSHPARLWKKMDEGKTQCRLCNHFCIIESDMYGKCGVRQNIDGELRTYTYDRVAAINIDPVEKKPLYHFLPGTRTFSFGTQGCNFGCIYCQNASLSQPPRDGSPVEGQKATPESLVASALEYGAKSISYTYSEPTIFFELMQDTARLAKEKGLKNIIVSNGFQSPRCLEELDGLIDAANIDLKSFSDDFYRRISDARLKPVLNTLKTIHEMGWWLEVTTLLIPDLNDDVTELEKLTGFIVDELGEETPWHISRFHPDYKLMDSRITPMESLKLARKAGNRAGLKYVYIGNISGDEYNSTFCPGCNAEVISRHGFSMQNVGMAHGRCKECGELLAGVFE